MSLFESVLDVGAEAGESPIWSVEERALFWADLHKSTVNRFDPATGENQAWQLPSRPGCIMLREGRGIVAPCQHGIFDLDLDTGQTRLLAEVPFDTNRMRFNDGKCDRQGRIWVGSLPTQLADVGKVKGLLYCFDGKKLTPHFQIEIPNGFAFSPDGRTMYRAETFAETIYAYDFDPDAGKPSNERIFAKTTAGQGRPDGATVDTMGNYWVALPGGEPYGRVARYTPDGKLDFLAETDVPAPTMVSFGGDDMSTLYVTSGSFEFYRNRPGADISGRIFAMKTEFQGIPEPKFRGV